MVKIDFPVIRTDDKPLKVSEIECPKCGSKDVFKFEKEIYVVSGKDFIKKPLYGCKNCNAGFVNLTKKDITTSGTSQVTIENVQNVLGNLSKGCFNVLGQIK